MIGHNKKLLTVCFSLILSVTLTLFTPLAMAIIGRSFLTNEDNLLHGMAVSLSLESTEQKQLVETLTTSNRERFIGIVTAKEANIITTVKNGDNVFVSTSGQIEVLTSNINGEIKKGDSLVASPLRGIVMRADTGDPSPVGYALEDFDYTKSSSEVIKDSQGNSREVSVFSINMEIGAPSSSGDEQKSFLSLVGESITGKPVSQLQVIAAVLLLFMLLTVEGSIIYGAAHSTIISVGRNPLAKKGIYKQLVQIFIVAGLIMLFGIGGIYLVLWV